jgi:hypothetical protein
MTCSEKRRYDALLQMTSTGIRYDVMMMRRYDARPGRRLLRRSRSSPLYRSRSTPCRLVHRRRSCCRPTLAPVFGMVATRSRVREDPCLCAGLARCHTALFAAALCSHAPELLPRVARLLPLLCPRSCRALLPSEEEERERENDVTARGEGKHVEIRKEEGKRKKKRKVKRKMEVKNK